MGCCGGTGIHKRLKIFQSNDYVSSNLTSSTIKKRGTSEMKQDLSNVKIGQLAVYENGCADMITGVDYENSLFSTGSDKWTDERTYYRMSDGKCTDDSLTNVFTVVDPCFLGYKILEYKKEMLEKARRAAFSTANITIGIFYEKPGGSIVYTYGTENLCILYYGLKERGAVPFENFITDWKPRRDLWDFPENPDPRLPPILYNTFDLLFDIKKYSQIYHALEEGIDPPSYNGRGIESVMKDCDITKEYVRKVLEESGYFKKTGEDV